MGLPKINFIRKQGLGRRDQSLDHISGLVAYNDTLPSGFASDDRIKKIFSVQQAESLGIVDTHSDETKATGGQVTITLAGDTADVETITIDGVTLGTYTVESGDAVGDVATGLAAAINALTSEHGFSAVANTADVDITAPAKMGLVLNNATIAFSSSGTGTATVTQFSSGVGSDLAPLHYHISEFFRQKPDGVLYVGIFAEGTYDATELSSMQDFAGGEIKQFGIFIDDTAFASSQLSATQTVLSTLRDEKRNAFAVLHADFSNATITALTDLSTLTASKVAVCLGEDGNFHQLAYSNSKAYVQGDKAKWLNKTYICTLDNTGEAPYDTDYWAEVSLNLPDIVGYSVSTLGNLLGTIAAAPVNESIAYVEVHPLSSGNILDVAGFATGDLYSAQSRSLIDTLTDYHYIYLRKLQGLSNTYYNDSWTAISESNDYATIENNRVMDKAERLQYTALAPKLNSTITVDPDSGQLSRDVIDLFENIADNPIEGMEIEGEISGRSVVVPPDQDVLTTSKITITTIIVPTGVAREIEVNNSYAVNLG